MQSFASVGFRVGYLAIGYVFSGAGNRAISSPSSGDMRNRTRVFLAVGMTLAAFIAFAVPICRCSLCKIEGAPQAAQACECRSLASTTLHALRDTLSAVESKCLSARSAAQE